MVSEWATYVPDRKDEALELSTSNRMPMTENDAFGVAVWLTTHMVSNPHG